MTITKVKYERTFPVGPYLNERIGFEVELNGTVFTSEEGMSACQKLAVVEDKPMEVIEQLRILAEQSHKEKFPHLYLPTTIKVDYQGEHAPIQTEEPVDKGRSREEIINAHLTTINECKTLRNLEMFANMVQRENEAVLFEAYNNKKKQLQ